MANWCENRLIITGNPVELEIFDSRFKSRPAPQSNPEIGLSYSFNSFVPVPREIAEGPYDAGKGLNGLMEALASKAPFDGHTWRMFNWGCKWDVAWDDIDLERSEGKLVYSYITANSPSSSFVANTSSVFPSLVFQIIGFDVLSNSAIDYSFQNGNLIVDASPKNMSDMLKFVHTYFDGYEEYMGDYFEDLELERA